MVKLLIFLCYVLRTVKVVTVFDQVDGIPTQLTTHICLDDAHICLDDHHLNNERSPPRLASPRLPSSSSPTFLLLVLPNLPQISLLPITSLDLDRSRTQPTLIHFPNRLGTIFRIHD